MEDDEEKWESLPGYTGYEVSTHGRVRSLPRVVVRRNGKKYTVSGGMLSCNSTSYPMVNIRDDSGVKRSVKVADLVLLTYVGPRPIRHESCHGDGKPVNNRLSNLRWDTKSSNMQDAVQHGTQNMVSRTTCVRGHKLTAPNLRRWHEERGRRLCLACAFAHNDMRRKYNTWTLDEAADLHYKRIMETGIGTYRRLNNGHC